MIETTEKKASLFASPGSQLYVFYNAAQSCVLAKTLHVKRDIIPVFSLFLGNVLLLHVGAQGKGSPLLLYHVYFILFHTSLKDSFFYAGRLFELSQMLNI